jgi:formylglycine-generating enzyme required for sulfatase activity
MRTGRLKIEHPKEQIMSGKTLLKLSCALGLLMARPTIPVAMSTVESSIRHNAEIGWRGQILPTGMKRGGNRDEYLWEKTGNVMLYVPEGNSVVTECPELPTPLPNPVNYFAPPPIVREVTMRGFYIDKYEMTVGQFRKFVADSHYQTEAERSGYGYHLDKGQSLLKIPGASWKDPGFPQADSHPVVMVSWNDAKAYCDWAGVRLPTVAEWTKAALWDDKTHKQRRFPWGELTEVRSRIFGPGFPPLSSPKDQLNENCRDDSLLSLLPPGSPLRNFMFGTDDGYPYTAPVGSFPKGASYYGVMDMAGNASEWCADDITDATYRYFLRKEPPASMAERGHLSCGDSWSMVFGFPLTLVVIGATMNMDGTRFDWMSTTGFRTAISTP